MGWQECARDVIVNIMESINIEWWMIDGLVGLVLLIAVIRGIIKGIGDTVLRLIGLAGGLALSVFYSDKVALYIGRTKLRSILYDHIYQILLPHAEAAAAEEANNVADMVVPATSDPVTEAMPKALGGLISEIVNNTAEAAAEKLTDIALGVFAVIVIMLAIWIVMGFIRMIYKHLRKQSFLIGFVDRLMGMVLGIIRGLIIACVVIAALVPVVTIFAPERVPDVIKAMNDTYVAGIIYDINPVMLLIRYVIG